MIDKPLPECIGPDARPFSPAAIAAITLDEIDQMIDDRNGSDTGMQYTKHAVRAMIWWFELPLTERDYWRGWLKRDIQKEEIRDWLESRR